MGRYARAACYKLGWSSAHPLDATPRATEVTILSHIERIRELAAEMDAPKVCTLCTPEAKCFFCGTGLVYRPKPPTTDED